MSERREYVTKWTDAEWRVLEHEVNEALWEENATLPLGVEYGALVAWSIRSFAGRMDSLSEVHRVGNAEKEETFCGEKIGAPVLRIALTPGWIRTQKRCRLCEQSYSLAGRVEGAA